MSVSYQVRFTGILGGFVLSLCVASAQQTQVYQAMAGAAPQNVSPQGQYPQQYSSPDLNAQNYPQQNYTQPQPQSPQSGYAQSNGNLSTISLSNMFLEYYPKQGSDFAASVYYNEGGRMVKRDISYDRLRKTFVVFWGDWCPHCQRFLTEFSKYAETLKSKGVKLVFIDVPSEDNLKNWHEPTVDDYNTAKERITSYGINLSSGIELVMLGERAALARSGIEGLPVAIAIRDAHEYFRGVGNAGTSKLQLSNPDVLRQFLEIWDDENLDIADTSDTSDEKSKATNKQKAKSSTGTRLKLKGKSIRRGAINRGQKAPRASADINATYATEFLNTTMWPTINAVTQPPAEPVKKRGGCTCS